MLPGALVFILSACSTAIAIGLDAATLERVRSKMLAISSHSWEYGTATQALLELEEADISIFGNKPFPPSRTLSTSSPVITLAEYIISIKPPGTLPLMVDGAVGDPASMGIAVLLANHTLSDDSFAQAASQQLDFLLNVAPRAPNGAISHRIEEVQLWADFVYMGPPFIAYYGALTNDIDLLRQAHRQIRCYRDVLRDTSNSVTTLWRHILLGGWDEPSHWGTGNAWAAAGAVRVLQTLAKSSQATNLQIEIWELVGWTTEILSAAWTWQKPNGILYNRVDLDDFPDCAWTALISAVTYRLAVLTGDESMIWNANLAFNYVATQIAADGTLRNAVDPLSWSSQGSESPEGQAFVLLLQAAWRDYDMWKGSGRGPTLSKKMNRRHRKSRMNVTPSIIS